MKKTDMTVSMPMNTYEELLLYKTKYEDLINKLTKCFDTTYFNTNNIIDFNANKAFNILKDYLSIKYIKSNFNIVK